MRQCGSPRGPNQPFLTALCDVHVMFNCRLPETTVVYPADVVLFEGILVFYNQEIRDMFHLRLFVDTDSDVRLSRRGKALGDLLSRLSHLWYMRKRESERRFPIKHPCHSLVIDLKLPA